MLTGGIIWSVANRLLGLECYMGGSGNEPAGALAALWGVIVCAPIIVFVLLSLSKEASRAFSPPHKALLVVLYSLLGGLGAFVFYNGGFRAAVEALQLSYGIQEFLVAAEYAVLVSALPLCALLVSLPRVRMPAWFIPLGTLLCTLAVSLTAMGTWLIGRPDPEVSQLRGFVVALVLRACMFALAYLYLSGRLKSIRLPRRRPVRPTKG